MVKNKSIIKTMIKNKMTDFCKDKLVNIFIILFYKFFLKDQLSLVRLLGFEPRTSWSVAKRSIQLSYRRILLNYQIKSCI